MGVNNRLTLINMITLDQVQTQDDLLAGASQYEERCSVLLMLDDEERQREKARRRQGREARLFRRPRKN